MADIVEAAEAVIAGLGAAIDKRDAEITRLRAENKELERKFETADKLRVFFQDKAQELAGKSDRARAEAFERAAQIIRDMPGRDLGLDYEGSGYVEPKDDGWLIVRDDALEAIRKASGEDKP